MNKQKETQREKLTNEQKLMMEKQKIKDQTN